MKCLKHLILLLVICVAVIWFISPDCYADQKDNKPAIIPTSQATKTRHLLDGTIICHQIEIYDADGIGSAGPSFSAQVKYPDGDIKGIRFDSTNGDYKANFWMSDDELIEGVYTYTVSDPAGNVSIEFEDYVEINEIKLVKESSISCTQKGTTTNCSWEDPDDPNIKYYMVNVRNYSGEQYYFSTVKNDFRIPPGILSPNSTCSIRISARDNYGIDVDNESRTNWVDFNTAEESEVPFFDLNLYYEGPIVETKEKRFGESLWFSLFVYDSQGAPDNIKSVTVTFPDGITTKPLFYRERILDNAAEYGNSHFQVMDGEYTFTVEDWDGHIFSDSKTLVSTPIKSVDTASMLPGNNEIVHDDTVRFRWDPVDGAAVYVVRLMDKNLGALYGFKTLATQFDVPAAIMNKGQLYKWKVTGYSDLFENSPLNVSQSDWSSYGHEIRTGLVQGTNDPEIDLDGLGAGVVHTVLPDLSGNYYQQIFWVKVTDNDGVPGNILSVKVQYPDGSTQQPLYYRRNESSTVGYYIWEDQYDQINTIQEGEYTFSVTDNEGRVATIQDYLVVEPIPVPQNLKPVSGGILSSGRQIISWDQVDGASRYQVRIYHNWNSQVHKTAALYDTSYAIPANVLNDREIFKYRVYAYREDTGQDVDNYSVNMFDAGMMPYFWVKKGGTQKPVSILSILLD